ncbi:MAG TPA: glycoside hydrolase family 43 protein [Polyangiaceae bacterium]|nr:glycoside hydrolase family 43 protein [Polyangiaceae bacterium]
MVFSPSSRFPLGSLAPLALLALNCSDPTPSPAGNPSNAQGGSSGASGLSTGGAPGGSGGASATGGTVSASGGVAAGGAEPAAGGAAPAAGGAPEGGSSGGSTPEGGGGSEAGGAGGSEEPASGGAGGVAGGNASLGGGGSGGLPRGPANGFARNPIVSHVFTADPAARVFEGRVYVYTSHDLDDQMNYDMYDYHAFSSTDLVNWQDHGVVLDAANISWTDRLYAPDCCHSPTTGKYYLYFPNGGSGIGVAVSDSPAGPFEDALGKPLIDSNTPGVQDVDWIFDPACFVDDDGQAYLYFGGGPEDTGDNARVIRLNDDMISLADPTATTIPAPDFFEASYMHKRDGKYYFSYSTTFKNHAAEIDYLVSDNPMTGFEHAGTILPNPSGNNGNNNHHSIVEYAGNWYIFYHNRVLSNRDGFSDYQRSITLDTLTYDEQGNILKLSAEGSPVAQLESVPAFSRVEAEMMADQRGVEVDFVRVGGERAGVAVIDLNDGDWIGYSQVDFGAGATAFHARVASGHAEGGTIELHVGGCEGFTETPGELAGTCAVETTGGFQAWTDVTCDVTIPSGVHDLCLRFAGTSSQPLLALDHFRFE